jgi:hypothetical protein
MAQKFQVQNIGQIRLSTGLILIAGRMTTLTIENEAEDFKMKFVKSEKRDL